MKSTSVPFWGITVSNSFVYYLVLLNILAHPEQTIKYQEAVLSTIQKNARCEKPTNLYVMLILFVYEMY